MDGTGGRVDSVGLYTGVELRANVGGAPPLLFLFGDGVV